MPHERLPITPEIVTWARQRAGLSLDEAAQIFNRIAEWESGEISPTYPQLEQLADKFKLPIAVFFFPEPPDVPPIEETFRTLPEAELSQIPSRIRMLLRKAKALQLNLSELTQGNNPANRLITRDLAFSSDIPVHEMAEEVRAYLGITLDQQIEWGDVDEALKHWRAALLDVGIFIFKDAFRLDEFSGFCLFDEKFPVIYVNNSSSKTRQIFTFFHELAHLLFRTSGIDTISDEFIGRLGAEDRAIEILCNQFAAEFLVPEAALTAALTEIEASEQTAEQLALRFHVSRESIYRRFLNRGLITQEQYKEAAVRWAGQRQGGGPGGDYYWTKLAYLGRPYVELAFSQFHQNRIDETQLAEYLDTKPRNVGRLEEYFERGNV